MLNLQGVEGDFAYRARDEAMLPMVRFGDYVVVETEQDPSLGDLVLYRMTNGHVQMRRVSQADKKTVLSVSHLD